MNDSALNLSTTSTATTTSIFSPNKNVLISSMFAGEDIEMRSSTSSSSSEALFIDCSCENSLEDYNAAAKYLSNFSVPVSNHNSTIYESSAVVVPNNSTDAAPNMSALIPNSISEVASNNNSTADFSNNSSVAPSNNSAVADPTNSAVAINKTKIDILVEDIVCQKLFEYVSYYFLCFLSFLSNVFKFMNFFHSHVELLHLFYTISFSY